MASVRALLARLGVLGRYAVSWLGRRDPALWVFGNVKGFRDSPRYLAEYIARTHPELQAWWIARNTSEAEAARSSGLRVGVRGQSLAARVQRRAGVAFLSNGFQDLEAAYLGGAYVVDVRHGQGTKRILLDQRGPNGMGSGIANVLRRVRRYYVSKRLAQIDMIVAPGRLEKENYVTAFGGRPSRIHVLGSPRFDVLLEAGLLVDMYPPDLRKRLRFGEQPVVLWLPTWRESERIDWLPRPELGRLERAMANSGFQLVVKPHPYSDPGILTERLPTHPQVTILPDDGQDATLLLRDADVLVTDYSSAAFDFALLDRPILLFVPDFEDYSRGQRLQQAFEQLVEQHGHRDWHSLLNALHEVVHGRDEAAKQLARRMRTISENDDAPGSCERIVSAVSRAVSLPPSVASQ